MYFSKRNTRMPSLTSRCPLAAASSFTDDHNVSAIARTMGKNPKTLLAKLNNDIETHQLTLAEAVGVTDITGDWRIIKAWAYSCGQVLFTLPRQGLTDDEFSDLLLAQQSGIGQLAESILKARADGVITEADYAGIHGHVLNSVSSLLQIDEELKQQVRERGSEAHG